MFVVIQTQLYEAIVSPSYVYVVCSFCFLGNNVDGTSEVFQPSLDSIRQRRQAFDLIFLYKRVNLYFSCNLISLFPLKIPCLNLRYPAVFYVPNNRVSATEMGLFIA